MKEHRILDQHDEAAAEQSLFRALLTLRDVSEVRAFLADLCTPAELQALKDRWLVAELLDRGLPYRQIHDRTGVSVTTIGRVARYLNDGAGGYSRALQRRRK
jgi:TrpR-related protein YerC/YecD